MNKKKVTKTCISIVILLLIWTIVTETDLVNSYILPSPLKVLDSFFKMVQSGEIFEDIYISYIRVLQGFFLATFLAFLLAMIRVVLPKYNDYYESILQFLKNVPPLSLISLLILWFGIGETTKIGIIVLTAFFPIYLNTVKGFVSCDKKLLEVGEIYGYSKTELNEEQLEFVKSLNLTKFDFYRAKKGKVSKPNKGKKYQCPSCGASFWSSKEMHVHCEDCDEDFEIEE